MHTLGIQECEEVPSDNTFEQRRRVQCYSAEQCLDEFMEQLERSMGAGYSSFMYYISTCDPSRALYVNKTDIHIAKILPNDRFEKWVEEIFLSNFMKKNPHTNRLHEVLQDLELFGLSLPKFPTLGTSHILAFDVATSHITRREREKGAQTQLVHFLANMELGELGEYEVKRDEDPHPLAYVTKKFKKDIFQCCLCIIGHKLIFPVGFRERLFFLLRTKYDLEPMEMGKLTDMMNINLDGEKLSKGDLYKICEQEKAKLREHMVIYHQDTRPFLRAPLVGVPEEEGKNPRYWKDRPIPKVTYSLIEQKFIHEKPPRVDKDDFKVPSVYGPLVKDTITGHLHVTGYFRREEGSLV